MINGEGLFYKDGKPDECVWENDVKFVIRSNEDDNTTLSIILAFLFYSAIIAIIIMKIDYRVDYFPLVLFPISIYVCILCEFCKSKTY